MAVQQAPFKEYEKLRAVCQCEPVFGAYFSDWCIASSPCMLYLCPNKVIVWLPLLHACVGRAVAPTICEAIVYTILIKFNAMNGYSNRCAIDWSASRIFLPHRIFRWPVCLYIFTLRAASSRGISFEWNRNEIGTSAATFLRQHSVLILSIKRTRSKKGIHMPK